jgi:hypothetical protein
MVEPNKMHGLRDLSVASAGMVDKHLQETLQVLYASGDLQACQPLMLALATPAQSSSDY